MYKYSIPSKQRLQFAFTFVTILVTMLACDISINTDLNKGNQDATRTAIQSTAVAIQVQQQQQQAQQQNQQPQQQQQQQPQQPAPTSTPQPDVVFEDISFSFDHSIAGGVDPGKVPGAQGQEGPPGGNYPEHYQFTFNGYVLQDRFHMPVIYIYPVAAYAAVDPISTERVSGLKAILASRPADSADALPFMPIWPAAQMIHAKISYFDFQSGSGLRFLSQYGQAANPINNREMFYTYQGITSDGAYYVAGVMPVGHPSLPADGSSVPNNDYAAFSENYASYAAQTTQMLNAQPDASFAPSLELLDAIFKSLKVK